MKRILVTGKSSFIAGRFFRYMQTRDAGYEVELVSVRGDGLKAIDFSGYDCVIHAAGIAHVGYRDEMRDEYMRVNRDLTLDVARAAKAAGVKQFIFLSSIIIYGPAAKGGQTRVIDAATAPEPENAYGLSKLMAERGLQELSDGDFRVAVLRLPMVYGTGSRGHYALLEKYARYLPVFPRMCGRRSAIYVDNLAEYLYRTVESGAAGTFFPRDPEPVTTPGLLREIRAAAGRRTWITKIFDPAVRMAGTIGPVRRIFGGLEYAPELSPEIADMKMYSLSEAVRREAEK